MTKIDTTALDALIAAVEAGTIATHDFDPFIPVFGVTTEANDAHMAYRGSIAAAFALHKSLVPPVNQYTIDDGPSGSGCHLVVWPDGLSGNIELQFRGLSDTPARAWLIAILKAYRAQVAE